MSEEKKEIDAEKEYEKLSHSKFKQQKLPAWRPVPTITSTTAIFVGFGVVYIVIGVIVLTYSAKIVEISKQYDDICTSQQSCNVPIEVTKEMEPPIMIYYQIDNFYQNHRRYVKSKSEAQLNGKYQELSVIKASGDCDPVVTNGEMGKNRSVSGLHLNENDVAIPCGLIAKSFFNDTFKLYHGRSPTNDSKLINISYDNIAWEADKKLKYKNIQNPPNGKKWDDIQWLDMEKENFIVWMRLAGLPNFRKLYGRIIDTKLEKGNYTFVVDNKFEVSAFSGKKYIVVSTVNAFGGKNTFLGISYIVAGVVFIMLAVIFLVGYQIHNRKNN